MALRAGLHACLAVLLAAALAAQAARGDVPALVLDISSSTRLLVIAPHPDDEALGAAGLMAKVRGSGGEVAVALLTSGDAFPEAVWSAERIRNPKPADYRNLGVIREKESRAALAALGVAPGRITFLGFPDEGVCLLASAYLSERQRAFESPYTDRTRPPPSERVIRDARYRGADVRREIERVAAAFRPTLIAMPHAEDNHPDHCATHIFASEAVAALRAGPLADTRVLHYLIHFNGWPAGSGTASALQPPADFPPNEGRWVTLPLTAAEAAAKERALLTYRSQVELMEPFMRAFARSNELYLEGRGASRPECWCDAANVATEAEPKDYRRRP